MNDIVKFSYCLMLFFLLSIGTINCVKEPTLISINDVRLNQVIDDQLILEIDISLFNNNPFGGKITKSEMEIFIDEHFIGIAKSYETFELKSKRKSNVTIDMQIPLNELDEIFEKYMSIKESSEITMDGIYSIAFGSRNLKLKSKSTHTINLITEFLKIFETTLKDSGIQISGIWPKKISISNSEFELKVNMKNPFPIEYELLECKLDILVTKSQKKIGTWVMIEPQTIGAKRKKEIIGVTKISNISVLSQLKNILVSRNLNMTVTGAVQVKFSGKIFAIPIHYKL